MTNLTAQPTTDPTSIYRHRDALFASDMLIAALKGFDFFTWLAGTPKTVSEICTHFGFHERPVDAMTTLFVAEGWLERDGDTVKTTASAREHLTTGSPWFIGPYFPPVSDRPIASDFLQILKSGKPASFASRKDQDDWHKAMETPEFAEEFTAMMDCRGVLLAQALAKHLDLGGSKRLLDIAGGSGVYACSFAAHFPDLRATVLDKPPVDRIARSAIEKRGSSDRVEVIASDMLAAPLPGGFDVHLYSNVLHDWDVPIVKQLLKASFGALQPGGLTIVHDAFLNDDKTGPLHVAQYSVMLMHVTQGRCYSTREIADWAVGEGFEFVERVDSAAARSASLFRKP